MKQKSTGTTIDTGTMIEDLVGDFDPENNEIDRRIFFEVTGKQIIEGEFDDDGSSEEDWGILEAPDPLAHAFNYSEDAGGQ